MAGGEEVEAFYEYPVAANTGGGGFNFVVITPDFEAWGKQTEAYPGSAAEKADEAWGEVAECKGSSLWASEKVE